MIKFEIESKRLREQFDQFSRKSEVTIKTFADSGGKKIFNYAQQKARWTDRTGHARQRLNYNVSKVPEGYKIALAHGVDYGIWLEMAHNRNYAIINEAILTVANQEIMPAWDGLMDRLSGQLEGLE